MTRTDYCNIIRDAGFRVRPLWQGKTEDPDGPRFDLTCYAIYGPDGSWLTNMILRSADGGVFVFFESPSIRHADDIAFLRDLTKRVAA